MFFCIIFYINSEIYFELKEKLLYILFNFNVDMFVFIFSNLDIKILIKMC